MVISICGDYLYKNILINQLKDVYKDKIVICYYFYIKFKSIIDTEKYKYKLLEKYSLDRARLEYSKIIDNTVNERIDKFLEDNKDKIIIYNVLNKDFYETKYFKDSDIKVLCDDNLNKYNKELFDVFIDDIKDIEVRKLVKVYE